MTPDSTLASRLYLKAQRLSDALLVAFPLWAIHVMTASSSGAELARAAALGSEVFAPFVIRLLAAALAIAGRRLPEHAAALNRFAAALRIGSALAVFAVIGYVNSGYAVPANAR